jgi:antitoxin (DNA-binding transcriptional repressor) of toxin-antitoxin stability system
MTHMTAILEEPSVPVRRVPIRELQQHAARVIRELAEAEEMAEITSRGEVVARLIPVSRAFAAMIARGEITSAESDRDISDIEPLPPRTDGISLSEVLMQMREEEPW